MALDSLDKTPKKREPSGWVTAISGPYPNQSTESLKEFVVSMRRGRQDSAMEYAAKKAEKMIADREAGLSKEPENPLG